jgi:hypothetical protein
MKKEFKNNTKIIKAQEGAILPTQEPQIESVQEELYEEGGEMSCEEIISLLRMSITQAHVWHHATNSYAQHGAFADYYTEMPELLDVFAEEYQGRFGLIRLTEAFDYLAYNKQTVLDYFTHLATVSETHAKTLPGHLKNRLEEIIGFIFQTIYKLRELS